MVPDFQLIMENMLMSEGYTTAAELAKKFFTLYKLSGDLLGGNPSPPGKQLHYDWGLRAIGSVLKVAGAFLRAEKKDLLVSADVIKLKEELKKETLEDIYEQGLLMRALRDFNIAKIAGDDAIVFMGLIKDLFGEVYDLMPKKRDYDFEDRVREISMEEETTRFPKKLVPSDYFVQNVRLPGAPAGSAPAGSAPASSGGPSCVSPSPLLTSRLPTWIPGASRWSICRTCSACATASSPSA